VKQILGSLVWLTLTALCALEPKVYLKNSTIESGESAELVIEVDGVDVRLPDLQQIGGTATQTYRSNYTRYINGQMTSGVKNSYLFFPASSMTIPSLEIIVDGQPYHSKALQLNVIKPKASADFLFSMELERDEVYVGESIELKFVFKRSLKELVRDMHFEPPKLDALWFEQIGGVEKKRTAKSEETQTLRYRLTPQKSGEFLLDKSFVELVVVEDKQDTFGFIFEQNKIKRVYADPVTLSVLPLPEGVSLIGSYEMSVLSDTLTPKSGEPLNLTITIAGEGNIEDIEPFEFKIEGATVISDKPVVTKGLFKQKIAIIADQSYRIPSVELRYFEKHVKQKKILKSDPIDVVIAAQKREQARLESKSLPLVQKETPQSSVPTLYLLGALITGFALGFVVRGVSWRNKEERPLAKRIQHANGRELLYLLLPYMGKEQRLDQLIEALEATIYHRSNEKIDKKEILAIVERFER
jgi:hypothetical protein